MNETTQTTTEELPSADAGPTTSNLERLRAIEDDLLALARAWANVPEIAEIIEKIECIRQDARASK